MKDGSNAYRKAKRDGDTDTMLKIADQFAYTKGRKRASKLLFKRMVKALCRENTRRYDLLILERSRKSRERRRAVANSTPDPLQDYEICSQAVA